MARAVAFEEDAALSLLLRENSLEAFIPLFVGHNVDMAAFLLLREAHLGALGVALLGSRLKLVSLIDQCRVPASGDDGPDSTSESVHLGGSASLPTSSASLATSSASLPSSTSTSNEATADEGPSSAKVDLSAKSGRRRARMSNVPTAPVFNADELEISECIGRGSFGDVFRYFPERRGAAGWAHGLTTPSARGCGGCFARGRGRWKDRDVAIKKLATSSPDEANLLCQFRHRNIVQCLGACYQAPHYVLVMEFAPENLKQVIQTHDITPATLIAWALEIATGMNYLHNEAPITVIHRDLKPANILVFPEGTLKVSGPADVPPPAGCTRDS